MTFNIQPEIISELKSLSAVSGIPMVRMLEDALGKYLPTVRATYVQHQDLVDGLQ